MGNHLKPYFTPKSPRGDGSKKMVIRVVETKALWNLILL